MFMGPFDQAVSWSTESIIGPRRFLEKVWRLGQKIALPDTLDSSASFQTLLHKTIKKVSEDIESMSFNTAVSSMMMLVNEMEKSNVKKEDFKMFLQILTPFAPHITEEIWRMLGEKKSIHLSQWPKWNPKKIIEEKIKLAVQINGKVRTEIMIDKDAKEDEVKKLTLANKVVINWLGDKEIKKFIYVPGRIINIVI
jgi:leucyl-tRNA synthetase